VHPFRQKVTSVSLHTALPATLVDTALDSTPSSRLDIHVVNRDLPDALEDPNFDNFFASSGFSRAQQLEEVNAGIPDTDNMFLDGIDGIDPRVIAYVRS
jgi:hypothetical protein